MNTGFEDDERPDLRRLLEINQQPEWNTGRVIDEAMPMIRSIPLWVYPVAFLIAGFLAWHGFYWIHDVWIGRGWTVEQRTFQMGFFALMSLATAGLTLALVTLYALVTRR